MLQRVHIQEVQDRPGRKPIARWTVDGKACSRSFDTIAEAKEFLSDLRQARRAGQRFDPVSGLPESWVSAASTMTVAGWCSEWLSRRWNELEPRSRKAAAEALARLVCANLIPGERLRPAAVQRWLSACSGGDPAMTRVLARRSVPMSALDTRRAALAWEEVRRYLDDNLCLDPKGKLLATPTAGRHRKNISRALDDAVAEGVLPSNPWPRPPRSRTKAANKEAAAAKVDTSTLPSVATAWRWVAAMRNHKPTSWVYQALTALVLLAGLRPSEAAVVERDDLDLPKTGWGRVRVRAAATGAGDAWGDDDEEVGDPKMGVGRTVPLPPALVAFLVAFLASGVAAESGPIFRTGSRNGSPYLFRHVNATMLIRQVTLGEAARRLGHSVQTLVSTYVGVQEGDEEAGNKAVGEFLDKELTV